MLKTYLGDIRFLPTLLESFKTFNLDGIKLYLIVEEETLADFLHFATTDVIVMSDSYAREFYTHDPLEGIRPGYINQQIAKLTFFLTGISDNYLCLDSDAKFVSPFMKSDFISRSGREYSVLVQDKDLQTDDEYFSRYWSSREKDLMKIRQFFGIPETRMLKTCHGFQIMNSQVLKEFKQEVVDRQIDHYKTILSLSPYEFTWYNYYLQLLERDISPIEPLFKVFHTEKQLIEASLLGMTEESLSRSYLGYVVQSNFHGFGLSLTNSKSEILSSLAEPRHLMSALISRLYRDFKERVYPLIKPIIRIANPTR